MTDIEHSNVMGGSTAERRIQCAGSYKLEKNAPEPPESDFAKEGTALHHAMEHVLLEMGDKPNLDSLLGMVFYNIVITQEHIDAKIKPAYRAFRKLCDMYGGGVEYLVEAKANMGDVIPGAFGYIDVLATASKTNTLIVLDWKFGDGIVVSAKENTQAAFYAGCALYSQDEDIRDIVGDSYDITFAIIQPRRGGNPDDCLDVWDTNEDYVEDFVELAIAGHERNMQDDAPLKTGPHCRYCKAEVARCPAKRKQISQATSVAPESMSVVELSKALEIAKELESWVKQVNKLALNELKNGVSIPGYKLVDKRGTRKWKDEEAATRVLVRKLKTSGAYEPRKLISPTKAEKALGKEVYCKVVAKHVTVSSSGVTMAADSDSRPDVSDPFSRISNELDNVKAAPVRK